MYPTSMDTYLNISELNSFALKNNQPCTKDVTAAAAAADITIKLIMKARTLYKAKHYIGDHITFTNYTEMPYLDNRTLSVHVIVLYCTGSAAL